jgi:hypothetical protein
VRKNYESSPNLYFYRKSSWEDDIEARLK